jgi:cell division transport system permease protein
LAISPRDKPRRRATPPAERPWNLSQPIGSWLLHHAYVLFSSLGQLSRAPLATLLTAAVIGIALALPAGLYVLLQNAVQLGQNWDGTVQISLFLRETVSDEQAEQLAASLRPRPEFQEIRVIRRDEALQEYRDLSGFSDALQALEQNPLPAVIVIKPLLDRPQQSQALVEELGKLPEVELAQYDMRWLQRLFAIMDIIKRVVLVLAGLLALGVLLIVGNTIRLAIYNRRAEIEIIKLFGATDAFIRRPFLYIGLWYGLFGGLIAWGLVELSLLALQEPVRILSHLYGSQYQLLALSLQDSLSLVLLSLVLGLLGAWMAVSRHLSEIEPR